MGAGSKPFSPGSWLVHVSVSDACLCHFVATNVVHASHLDCN